jgi:hypothetical protein
LLQAELTKSPFSDYTVLSGHSFTEPGPNKGEVKRQHAQFVLVISNWHFVRDSLSSQQPRACQPADCTVAIKLASSVFKPVDRAGVASAENGQFYFDRNGVSIPYEAFQALTSSDDFIGYLTQIKSRFEREGCSLKWENDQEEDDDPEQAVGCVPAQEVLHSQAKKAKKAAKKLW